MTAGATAPLINHLRQGIRDGVYPSGTWLPTERELAERFGVPRRTARRAIDLLTNEGLVQRQPRFRPVVASPMPTSFSSPSPAAVEETTPKATTSSEAGARLVALIMWHGGQTEPGVTAQTRIFWGMNQRLARSGYHGIFLDLGDAIRSESENAQREAVHLRYAIDQGFAGVVFYAYAYRQNRDLIQKTAQAMPLVLIDRMIPGMQFDYVGIDNFGAMRAATEHLLSLGHRRIVFATTPESINAVQERVEGYRQAMAEAADGPLPADILTFPLNLMVPSPSQAAWPVFDSLFGLHADVRPTAVCCVNDYVAQEIYYRLARLGLRVPEDISLCGFDDVIPLLPNRVGLTTVAQPFEEIGRAAADCLINRLQENALSPGGDERQHQEMAARLVLRESTRVAAAHSDEQTAVKELVLVHTSS